MIEFVPIINSFFFGWHTLIHYLLFHISETRRYLQCFIKHQKIIYVELKWETRKKSSYKNSFTRHVRSIRYRKLNCSKIALSTQKILCVRKKSISKKELAIKIKHFGGKSVVCICWGDGESEKKKKEKKIVANNNKNGIGEYHRVFEYPECKRIRWTKCRQLLVFLIHQSMMNCCLWTIYLHWRLLAVILDIWVLHFSFGERRLKFTQ